MRAEQKQTRTIGTQVFGFGLDSDDIDYGVQTGWEGLRLRQSEIENKGLKETAAGQLDDRLIKPK